jgi:hypothetical protein
VDGVIAKAQMASLRIVDDLIKAARPVDVLCARCDGLRWIYIEACVPPSFVPGYLGAFPETRGGATGRARPACRGAGTIPKLGKAHAQDRVLEICRAIGRGAKVQVVQNFSAPSHPSAVATLASVTIDENARRNHSDGQI